MQPDRVRIISDEFLNGYPVNSRGALNAFLLPVDEDGHVFLPPSPFRGFLCGCKFAFLFRHDLSSQERVLQEL
jgi:hypothetical protein